MEALTRMQEKFYAEFPAHASEAAYKFASPSTMKPTRVTTPKGGLNQIPGECTISGDVRVTPFYDVSKVKEALERYVAEINADLGSLPLHGPCSKYDLPELGFRGRVELAYGEHALVGVACKLDSPGHKALCDGITRAFGKCEPFSISGSLPLVDVLQNAGYDLQIVGFGLLSTYHANNEYCLLSGMQGGFATLAYTIAALNAPAAE